MPSAAAVSGFTMTSTSAQFVQTRRSVVQNSRSTAFNFWARTLALEHNYLLPEGEDFDHGVPASAKEHSEGGQKSADEWEHEFYVVTSLAQLVDYADSWAFGDAHRSSSVISVI